MSLLIGADPELFVKNSAGEFVSGYDLVKGTKLQPFEVPDGAVQVDGMALEFNIKPASTREEFVRNISSVCHTLEGMIPKGLTLSASPTAFFEPTYFRSQPELSKVLGCDPDYNAWTRKTNERPVGNRPMRSGGGHVHLGFDTGRDPDDPAHREDCFVVARQMDYFLGIPSVYWDDDRTRRQMYGKAGACRVKPYGVEYRTLSNRWLASEELVGYVFDAAKKGMEALEGGLFLGEKYGNAAQSVIDWGAAYNIPKDFWETTGLKMPPHPEGDVHV